MDEVNRALALADHWLTSGDERYLRTASNVIASAEQQLITECHIHLHTGGAAGRLGALYDAAWPCLTAAERQHWVRLGERFLRLYLDTVHDYGWTVTCVPNANAVGNSGAGRLALAMLTELPELARETLHHTRKHVESFLDYCGGDDGGNTEGVQYWEYGLTNFVLFAHALERTTGSDAGWFERPQLRQAMNMIRLALCPDGGCHGQNDTIPVAIGGHLAWFFASRYDDPLALWYGDHCRRWHAARRAAGKPTPYKPEQLWALLFRPEAPEAIEQPEPLPVAIHLPSIEYAAIRSSDRIDSRWMVGVKGARPPYTHHHQQDPGSFFVHLDGERLLIDPGYYKGNATDHCLPLIGGQGPRCPAGWAARIIACRAVGDRRYLACDATAAYDSRARRVVRHLLMLGEAGVILLDDLVADAPITSQLQCGGVPALYGDRTLTVTGQRASLRVEVMQPAGCQFDIHGERNLHDTHWGYHFADCRLFPVTITYTASATIPLVALITDAAATGRWRCAANSETIRITPPTGNAIVFERQAGGWTLS